jgi:hypothetical protein
MRLALPRLLAPLALALAAALPATAAAPKPLKVLLVTGGCCHDYVQQKDLLKAGLEADFEAGLEAAGTCACSPECGSNHRRLGETV